MHAVSDIRRNPLLIPLWLAAGATLGPVTIGYALYRYSPGYYRYYFRSRDIGWICERGQELLFVSAIYAQYALAVCCLAAIALPSSIWHRHVCHAVMVAYLAIAIRGAGLGLADTVSGIRAVGNLSPLLQPNHYTFISSAWSVYGIAAIAMIAALAGRRTSAKFIVLFLLVCNALWFAWSADWGPVITTYPKFWISGGASAALNVALALYLWTRGLDEERVEPEKPDGPVAELV